jgi:hypothetical protein
MTEVSPLKKAEQKLKMCEDFTFCRGVMARVFGGSQGVLLINFLRE